MEVYIVYTSDCSIENLTKSDESVRLHEMLTRISGADSAIDTPLRLEYNIVTGLQ